MNKSVLATFRVDEEKWKRFQQLAKESGYSASALLVGFIDKSIDSGVESPPLQPNIIDTNIDKIIESYLEKNLDKYIDDSLDKIIESYLEKNLDKYIDNTLDKRVERNSTENIDNNLDKGRKSHSQENLDKHIDSNLDNASVSKANPQLPGLTRSDRRWLEHFKQDEFKATIERAIGEGWDNQQVVDRLFAAGFGKNGNREAYPATLVAAMKKAYQYQASQL
jgi:hypothetical protein